MDANGSRFWSLQAAAHWPTLGEGGHVRWLAACSALGLASERELEAPADTSASRSAALLALNEVPRALDAQGVVCSWHAPSQAIVVRSAHLVDAAIALPLDAVPTDLCVWVAMACCTWPCPGACSCTTCAGAGRLSMSQNPALRPGAWPPTPRAVCGCWSAAAGGSRV